jgi:hypothetical protein
MLPQREREEFRRQFIVLLVRFFGDGGDRAIGHLLDEALKPGVARFAIVAVVGTQSLGTQAADIPSDQCVGKQAALHQIDATGEKSVAQAAASFFGGQGMKALVVA